MTMAMTTAAVTAIATAAAALLLYLVTLFVFSQITKSKRPLPPGPKPKPLIGNLTDLPRAGQREFEHWAKHKELYGPISSVSVFGQTLIIINDVSIASELMEKRGNIYSGRPRMMFSMEMCGWEYALSSTQNDSIFRTHRKNIGRILGSQVAVSKFNALQDIESRRFLLRVLDKPDDVVQHIRTEAGAIIVRIVYGYNIEPHQPDSLVDLIDLALVQFSRAAVPGAWLVDIIPALRYLPDWFPVGTGFKKIASHYKQTVTDAVEKPFAYVKHQMAYGKHEPSFTSRLLDEGKDGPQDEYESIIKWSALSLYGGGADTTVSALSIFFHAMTLYPDVQRKAQDEIARVVGSDRLPNFADREHLTYIEALIKEIYRWHPVAPMGLPHRADEEGVMLRYRIPKGALLLPNIWVFTHDPKTFDDPMAFKPERFLGEHPEPDPRDMVFGFGRRICPGRLLADTSIYLTIAQSLAVFNVRKAMDKETGQVIEPVRHFTPGIISHPVSFKIAITPRSAQHENLIRKVEVEHPWIEGDSKLLMSLNP